MSYEYDGFGDMVWVDDPASDADTGGSGAGGNGSGNDGSGVVANTGAGDSTDANGWTTDERGIPYKINADGSPSFMNDQGKQYSWNNDKHAFTDTAGNIAGDQRTFLNLAKSMLVNPDGTLKANAIGAIGGGLLGAIGALNSTINKVGYQGGIKDLVAQRTMATAPVAGHRPGEGGTNYGGEVQYTDPAAHAAAPAAPVQTVQPKTTADINPWVGKMSRGFAIPGTAATAAGSNTTGTNTTTAGTNTTTAGTNVMTPAQLLAAQQSGAITHAAQGGIMGLAHGGRYLQGNTDGMADKLRTSIDNKQPAALSHGEFVVPADVVSHLGNGNSDAGAQKLYSMMDKIRQARTGTKKQGKQINPDKFMPGGLAAAYAAGGSVRHFATGDAVTGVPSGTTGVDQTMASWTGTYAPDMLAKTAALTSTAMPQYKGTLTAGESDLQKQAFAGASENAQNGYTPTQFTSGTFNTSAANQYMNPYLQASLNPQLDEARRQSQIDQQLNMANSLKSGSFGGGASDMLNRSAQRDLGSKMSDIVGKGYNTAYTDAMAQYNADQNRNMTAQQESEKSRQYGADYGRNSIKDLAELGATQRGITSEGVAADKKAFEEARDDPYNRLKFQKSMLEGLPISATNYTSALPSTAQQTLAGAGGVAGLLGNKTNYTLTDVTDAMKRLGFDV